MFLVAWQLLFCSCVASHNSVIKNDVLTMEGDLILGGLFDLHQLGKSEKQCGQFNEIPGYQYMEAMLYAIDQINTRQDLLPGIKLGTIIYDTCRSPTISADKTKEFIKLTLLARKNSSELAGVIGPFKSGNSIIVANFLRVFRIPQISYGSLSVKLSNKELFNYFFRTVPPDSFFAAALVTLLQTMAWNYVSIVYSTGTWSETGAQEIEKALKRNHLCLANYLQLARFPTHQDYRDVIATLAKQGNHVVILVTIQRDSRELLFAKKHHKQLYFVGSLEWSNRDDITNGVEGTGDGTLTFGHRKGQIPAFVEYFRSLRFNNYTRNNKQWIGEYWQITQKCQLENFTVPSNHSKVCTGNEKNINYKELAPIQVVINAVEAMATALDDMHRKLCPNTTKLCKEMRPLNRTMLLEFLRNASFKDAAFHQSVSFNRNQEVDGNYTLFNFRLRNGSYSYVEVGSWVSTLYNDTIVGKLHLDQSQIRWGNQNRPLSSCKPHCGLNQVTSPRDDKCCWQCVTCASNDVIVNNTCVSCDKGFVPDMNQTSCLKLALQYVHMDTPVAIFFIILSCLGIMADFAVCACFIKYKENRLIKASGREMCYFIFAGIAVIFMSPLTFLAKPSEGLCYLRRFIIGISFSICYAPLLVKMWRIHRIFKTTNQLRRMSGFIGRRSLLVITCALIAIQGLFSVLVFNTDPPHLVEKFYENRNELVLECSFNKLSFSIYFIYNVILLLSCTLYAFLTRRFPKNFNEAFIIGITMYLTCIVWIIFFATFLNADYSIVRAHWIAGCSLVTGWITLLGLFAPKLYQLYTKTEFTREMLITWASLPTANSSTSLVSMQQCERCKQPDKPDAVQTSSSNQQINKGFPTQELDDTSI